MDLKSIAEAYQSIHEKKLDPVGKEDGDGDKLEIAFDKAGSKKVLAGFVSKP